MRARTGLDSGSSVLGPFRCLARRRTTVPDVNLLFLDESGTHEGSPTLVVGGVALHESHLATLTRSMDELMRSGLAGRGVDPADYEFHAAEMKSPPTKRRGKASPWLAVPEDVRLRILKDAYALLGTTRCGTEWHACGLFGAVLDHRFRASAATHEREQLAYETVLNKFDDSIDRDRRASLGLVIHDQRLVAERDIQTWTREWQAAAGRIGKLERLAVVPFFADSRGSRLLQAADLVSWALNRYYTQRDERWVSPLWSQFDFRHGHMHGLIHLSPEFARRACDCPPCARPSLGDLSPV